MPQYMRFQDGIRQKFWEFRGYNPTCGVINLELGTKIFAWGNIIYGSFTSILCALIFILPLFLGHGGHNHHEVMNAALKEKLKTAKDANISSSKWDSSGDEWIEKLYLKQSFVVLQGILFLMFIIYSLWWFASWKLKKSIVERDVPNMKKYFLTILLLSCLLCVPYFIETEILWSRAFLMDIPIFIFQIMGLMFTHAYIVSLENPASNQQDDLNRIQFNA